MRGSLSSAYPASSWAGDQESRRKLLRRKGELLPWSDNNDAAIREVAGPSRQRSCVYYPDPPVVSGAVGDTQKYTRWLLAEKYADTTVVPIPE